ncbi:MAG: aminoacetone oxidase family FAD-binding enzyme [Clostridia bacterium]|nr:aminoacetone oxidase family FAD-binding enzyme [Clostridia bacterium]
MKQTVTTAIIGGGAAGLFLATLLPVESGSVAVFERGSRVGRKLSATGNGQGNISNLACESAEYFSSSKEGDGFAKRVIARYNYPSLAAHMERLGVLLLPDERGRVYPTGKQASALTDALRFSAAERGVAVRLDTLITQIEKRGEYFLLRAKTAEGEREFFAENVVLCTGGKAAKNFGTDGSAYALAQSFSHTLTPLYPSLVQLKTDTKKIKTLKGIRVSPARVTAAWWENGKRKTHTLDGDILFTDYGVSGDVIFRLSAFFTDKLADGVTLSVRFLPAFSEEKIYETLVKKRALFPDTPFEELLGGIVNNQVGRAVLKTVPKEDLRAAASAVCDFKLSVSGTLGFDYAQVTKGGVRLEEVDENLQSKKAKGLYFAGEILDIDGQCGGFNLQWAYASAACVAAAIGQKTQKARGQV